MKHSLTLQDILLACKSDLGYGTVPSLSDETGTRLTRYINDGYRQIMRLPGMEKLRFQSLPLTTTSGVSRYGLLPTTEEVLAIVDQTSQRKLIRLSVNEWRRIDPGETTSGTPWAWVDAGFQVLTTPNNSLMYVRSQSPADTTQRLTGTYIDIYGFNRDFDVQLNGQTNVLVTKIPPLTWPGPPPGGVGPEWPGITVLTAQLSAPCAGDVALLDADQPIGTTPSHFVGYILSGEISTHIWNIYLWPTPTSANNYLVDSLVVVVPLAGPTDTPRMPFDFHNLLIDYTKMREYEQRGDERFQQSAAMYNDGLKALKNRINNPPDFRPVAGGFAGLNPGSNLGPWFPWL